MENSSLIQESQIPSPTANPLRHRPSSIPITRSDPNNPYPTTFVQADTSSFKQVVQMLTGSTESNPTRSPIPPMKTGPRKDKLYERRNSLKNFKISPLAPGFLAGYSGSPRPATPESLSPSILDFPSLTLSPVTPLIPDPFNRGASNLNTSAEDKAIKEKGFYFHPSPVNTPRDSEPRLLPLFPVTSPRVADS
ncbi:VQ motif-containing protein 4-like [Salvia hispanica]|uniref:VQ motif-containing protein 4-like n=1 Tax=Salvia hispanica TaxID=49212 RepID=UPI0020094BDD|nr:VQ motif-containing protein 4-like [Salvia hispanica]